MCIVLIGVLKLISVEWCANCISNLTRYCLIITMLAANHVDHFFRKYPCDNNNEHTIHNKYTYSRRTHISSHFSNGSLKHMRIIFGFHVIHTDSQTHTYQQQSKLLSSWMYPFCFINEIVNFKDPKSYQFCGCVCMYFNTHPKIKANEFILKIALGLEFDDPLANIFLEIIMVYNLCVWFSQLSYFIIWINKKAKTQMIYLRS